MDLNKGVPKLFAYWEKLIWKIILYIQLEYVPLDGFCLEFFRDFSDFFFFFFFGGGICGANHL